MTRARVEYGEARGRRRADEQSAIGLIQGHREVHLKSYWPPRNRMRDAIDCRYLLEVRQIRTDIWS